MNSKINCKPIKKLNWVEGEYKDNIGDTVGLVFVCWGHNY